MKLRYTGPKVSFFLHLFLSSYKSRERFQIEMLIKLIHFNDITGALSKQDKLLNFRPLASMMCEKYKEIYKPGPDLVNDENW